MVNFLHQLENPQFNHRAFFEVMRDFRKGGLSPDNFEEFMQIVENLPPVNKRTSADYTAFNKLGLKDVSQADFPPIMREVIKRIVAISKKCWHPLASPTTCNVDHSGNIIVSAAHSIQNNGVLSQIAEDSHVVTYAVDLGDFAAKKLSKNIASIFWGFCNTHDGIFSPIETAPYTKTDEQNFLFAYRGFVVSSQKKSEVGNVIHFGAQAEKDTIETKKIFDQAIINKDYSCLETVVIELPSFYPIAVSSCFYLDYDFEGNPIPHSKDRMEYIYVTLLPDTNKTYFILSYLKSDKHIYGQLGQQLIKRNNYKSDISVLLAAHVENIYYNPKYYQTFIEPQESKLSKISEEAQIDIAEIGNNDQLENTISLTPSNYLSNPHEIALFGY